jgi:hypothetical protein
MEQLETCTNNNGFDEANSIYVSTINWSFSTMLPRSRHSSCRQKKEKGKKVREGVFFCVFL